MHGVNVGLQSYKGIAEKMSCLIVRVRESKMVNLKNENLIIFIISYRNFYFILLLEYAEAVKVLICNRKGQRE